MEAMERALKQRGGNAEHPGFRQSLASDPMRSHWVGASAGTGKTKVLIDRVLRLMLPRHGGAPATPPERVLCLTFTKTAAAEMSNRIYESLSAWAVMEDEKLAQRLEELTGGPPTPDMMRDARRLFARVLDAPGGLKIMTIHSFCQSVLRRFPVEAGVAPHFELMDEQSAVEYLTRCLHDVIADARRAPGSALDRSFALLALHLDAAGMSELMSKIMSGRSLLGEILSHHGDAEGAADRTVEKVYAALGLSPGETEEDVVAAAGDISPADEGDLRRALAALRGGGRRDNAHADAMQPWLEQKARRAELFAAYCGAFLKDDGELFSQAYLASKAARDACPDIIDILMREGERLRAIARRACAARLAALNAALLTVASGMVGRYARYKRMTDRLDFDDLIIRTCALLSEDHAVQWVLYKLDEGIDHILVDEAQDTSPHQWRVVQALSAEFFAGRGARDDTVRTLFVVGDKKQSIFSFQGADPAAFAEMQAYFGLRARDVQEGWEITLEYSFRSTRTVLEVVDSVFSHAVARRGVVSAGHDVRHLPFRAGHAGLVEIWPLVAPPAPEDPPHWQMPTQAGTGNDAAALLARRIAAAVAGWIGKEKLESRGRCVRAGDVLVLVQSRGTFVELLMRAFKDAGVPVAGIDRMTLTEEIAVMDLVAAARFALLPGDDLTLATVLKSPLVGMGEEELYALCHDRPGTLWAALRDKRPELHAFLSGWVRRAGRATPYEFFAGILSAPCFADPVSGRRAMHARLGFDIHDALDEFLNACLHYEQAHTPALQKFVNWFLQGQAEIKREQEAGRQDQVRIMTAHGAKGLQAPIVIMPDTVKKLHDHNKGRIRLIWPRDETGVPLWSPRAEFDAEPYARLRDGARAGQEEEYRRLLYVAMTRAEDRLYICGYRNVRQPADDCWYNLILSALPQGGERIPDGTDSDGNPAFIIRYRHPQEVPPRQEPQRTEKEDAVRAPLPEWAMRPPAPEVFPPAPLAPSRPGEDEPAATSPLAADRSWRFRRGVIVHRILEVLPQIDPAKWEATLGAYLARPALGIPAEERGDFAAEILAVLRHPAFAPIFGPGSRAEVPVTAITGNSVLSGQMDRILVTEREVFVIDYKTNRPPPKSPQGVPAIYLKQMAAYRAAMRGIYPRHVVRSALLWTDGPFLMQLPDELLDRHAP